MYVTSENYQKLAGKTVLTTKHVINQNTGGEVVTLIFDDGTEAEFTSWTAPLNCKIRG
jgi:hypothetical protein